MSETNAEPSASSDLAEGNSGDEKQQARWSPHTFQTQDEAARRIQRRSQERLLQRQALSEFLPAATSKFSSVETLSAGMSNYTEAPNAAGFSSNDEVELPHAMAARYDAKVLDQEAVVAAERASIDQVISRPFSSPTPLSSPAGSPRFARPTGDGNTKPSLLPVGEDDMQEWKQEPFVPLSDKEAISQLRDLVYIWDDQHNCNGLPPMLDSDADVKVRQTWALARHNEVMMEVSRRAEERAAVALAAATDVAAKKLAEEVTLATEVRQAKMREMATYAPPLPPSTPRRLLTQRPMSARSPHATQITLSARRPATARAGAWRRPHEIMPADRSTETWPLPRCIISPSILALERGDALYRWWAGPGHLTSPGSITLPTVLDKKELARVARASGEVVLRGGNTTGAARLFRKAAQLGQEDSELRWRLRECEAELAGGLDIMHKTTVKRSVAGGMAPVHRRERSRLVRRSTSQ